MIFYPFSTILTHDLRNVYSCCLLYAYIFEWRCRFLYFLSFDLEVLFSIVAFISVMLLSSSCGFLGTKMQHQSLCLKFLTFTAALRRWGFWLFLNCPLLSHLVRSKVILSPRIVSCFGWSLTCFRCCIPTDCH